MKLLNSKFLLLMTQIEKSILILAPLEKVFAYASDYQKWEEWFEGVSGFKPITEIARGNKTRYAYKAKMMGLSIGMETEINDFMENEGWTGVSTKGMPHKTFWKFEPVDEGTKMTYGLEYALDIPWIGNWLDKTFMRPQWDKIISNSLKKLKIQFE